jgi:hypothetical protein
MSVLAKDAAGSYDRRMTRRAVRLIWVLTGLCLVAGVLVSAAIWLGAPDRPWQHALKELSTLLDVVALLLWMGIFAIYWARRQRRP